MIKYFLLQFFLFSFLFQFLYKFYKFRSIYISRHIISIYNLNET